MSLEPRLCIICSKQFQPKKKTERLCGSPECRKRYNVENQRRYRAAARAERLKGLADTVCIVCGKKFQAKTKRQKICSDECRREYKRCWDRKTGQLKRKEKRPQGKTRNYWSVCLRCGKQFFDRLGGEPMCEPCTIKEWEKQERQKRKQQKTVLPLDDCIKIANEAGLSYGEAEAKGLFKRGDQT